MKKRKIPNDWRKVDIRLIHKKGDRHKIKNYRSICITSMMAKIYSKVIARRISRSIDEQQSVEQAGFRKGYTTVAVSYTHLTLPTIYSV